MLPEKLREESNKNSQFDEGVFVTLMPIEFYARFWWNLQAHDGTAGLEAIKKAILMRFNFSDLAQEMYNVQVKIVEKPSKKSLHEFSPTMNEVLGICTKAMIEDLINELMRCRHFKGYEAMAGELSKYYDARKNEIPSLELFINQDKNKQKLREVK